MNRNDLRYLPGATPSPIRPNDPPDTLVASDSFIGQVHGDNWSQWYSCGDVVDEWIITVYANDVLVQFAPLRRETLSSNPIKRRVGESGRDRQRGKGIGMFRVKSAVPGANGTFDLELWGA